MKKIVAIDPGISTGVAFKLGEDEYHTITISLPEIEAGFLWDIIHGAEQVIIEYFAVFDGRQKGRVSKYGLRTVEIVGMVMGHCKQNNIPLARQSPQNRKAFISKARELVESPHTDHQVDALSHLLAWESLHRGA